MEFLTYLFQCGKAFLIGTSLPVREIALGFVNAHLETNLLNAGMRFHRSGKPLVKRGSVYLITA